MRKSTMGGLIAAVALLSNQAPAAAFEPPEFTGRVVAAAGWGTLYGLTINGDARMAFARPGQLVNSADPGYGFHVGLNLVNQFAYSGDWMARQAGLTPGVRAGFFYRSHHAELTIDGGYDWTAPSVPIFGAATLDFHYKRLRLGAAVDVGSNGLWDRLYAGLVAVYFDGYHGEFGITCQHERLLGVGCGAGVNYERAFIILGAGALWSPYNPEAGATSTRWDNVSFMVRIGTHFDSETFASPENDE